MHQTKNQFQPVGPFRGLPPRSHVMTSLQRGSSAHSKNWHTTTPFPLFLCQLSYGSARPSNFFPPSNWRFRAANVFAFAMIECTAAGAGIAPALLCFKIVGIDIHWPVAVPFRPVCSRACAVTAPINSAEAAHSTLFAVIPALSVNDDAIGTSFCGRGTRHPRFIRPAVGNSR